MIEGSEHMSLHMRERVKDPETLSKMRENIRKAGEEAKKWHHSEEGRKWHSEHAKNMHIEPKAYKCEWCGKEYYAIPIGKNHFCSNKCKTAYRYHSGVDNELRVCAECGKEFIANKYSRTQFCSRSCGCRNGALKRYRHL